MKASDMRVDKEASMMAPIYDQIRKAQSGGASYIQVGDTSLSPEQKRVLERDGFSVTKHKDCNGREEWEVYRISWME